jgi:hypothetical protein
MVVRRLELGVTACGALVLTLGCPLDERTLHGLSASAISTNGAGGQAGQAGDIVGGAGGGSSTPSSSTNGSGGAATTAAGSDGSSSTGGEGGEASGGGPSGGTGGSGGGEPGDCPDLDRNAVADCEETLVLNPGFKSDASGWDEGADVLVHWDGSDGMDSGVSGSISVNNTASIEGRDVPAVRGVQQCIVASGGERYLFLTQVRVESGQSQGWGGINVWFFDQPGCKGDFTSTLTPLLGTTLGWSHTQVIAEAPSTARSMLVRLVVTKYFSAPPFAVEFDNVLVRPE